MLNAVNMSTFDDVIAAINKTSKYKDSTKYAMRQNILKLSESTPTTPLSEINAKLLALRPASLSNYSMRTRSTFLSHAKRFLTEQKIICPELEQMLSEAFKEQNNTPQNKVISTTWPETVAEYNKLVDKMKESTDVSKSDARRFLIASFYVLLPPLRISEYLYIYINSSDQPAPVNLYDVKTRKLMLDDHKTSEKSGTRIIEIQDKLHTLIMAYVKRFGIADGQRLFNTDINALRVDIKSVFKCNPHDMRHLYISHMLPRIKPADRAKLAKIMGHGLNVQSNIYFSQVVSTGDGVEAN